MSEKDWNNLFWLPVILVITGTFQFFRHQEQKGYIFWGIAVLLLIPFLIRKFRKS